MTKNHLSDGTPVCDRCCTPTNTVKMSWFNKDVICLDCSAKEAQHKDYKKAKEAVYEHERAGDMDWEGIGLPIDLVVKSF